MGQTGSALRVFGLAVLLGATPPAGAVVHFENHDHVRVSSSYAESDPARWMGFRG
jgi:hypothetical protein